MRRPTIIDVARLAGVSKSTVSLVLQSSPMVKAATREAVEKAMADLGYVYNQSAANLRKPNRGLIGLVISDICDPACAEFATTAQMALAARGYATAISHSAGQPEVQAQMVAALTERGPAAVLIVPVPGDGAAAFALLRRAAIPVLQVLRQADPDTETFPYSGFDYRLGAAMATRHLIEQGAHKIAFVGGEGEDRAAQERIAGYGAAMQASGLPRLTLPGPPTRRFGLDATAMLMMGKRGFDAALCHDDSVAMGVMAGYARAGRQVGRDLRLVGFGDSAACAEVWPPLSSVRCNIAQLARDSAETVLNWLENGTHPPPEQRAAVGVTLRASSMAQP